VTDRKATGDAAVREVNSGDSVGGGRPGAIRSLLATLGLSVLAACSGSETIRPTPAVVVTATTPPVGVVGTVYSHSLSATGGDGTYTWSLVSGSLPPGLVLSSSGNLSGTPAAAGTSDFEVRVTSADQDARTTLQITVVDPVSITTSELPDGRTGTAYGETLVATGGTGTYAWSIASGGLPPGLTLDAAGLLSGIPAAADSREVTVRVESGHQAVTRALSLTVFDPLDIATTDLAEGVVGVPYVDTLVAAGGSETPLWRLTDGSLPQGLSLDPAGVVSGTPSSIETTSFTVDASSGYESASRTFQLAVFDTLVIATTSLPDAATEASYRYGLVATGGTGSYTWSATAGELPDGLGLSEEGVLSGTPTGPGTSSFTAQAVSGSQIAGRSFSLAVVDRLTITTTTLEPGVAGTPYRAGLEATGGAGEPVWSVSAGSLPDGLVLEEGGSITGTPTTAGEAEFTIQATSGEQTDTRVFRIQVFDPLAISTSTLPTAVVGEAYSATLAATGGTGTTTWSLSTGALPEGLVLDASGDIAGTPTSTGTTSLEVRAESGLQSATAALEITVLEPLVLFNSPLPGGQVNAPYAESVVASGGDGSYTFRLLDGELPTGTALAEETGEISGTPTEARDFTFTIEVTSGGLTADAAFTVTIEPEPCSLDSLPDTDGDRLPDCAETNDGIYFGPTRTGTSPSLPDTDGDGIEDGDEVLGTVDGLDLPAMGTNPLRQNILIEYDWFEDSEASPFHDHRPSASSIAKVAAAFAAAPVDNPDGSTGILAIQDYGQGGPFNGGTVLNDPDGCLVGGVGGSEYAGYLSANFATNRLGYFHYSLIVHRYGATATGSCAGASSSSGQAFYNDHRSLVSSSIWHNGSSGDQWVANTIVHEVGHNLNLSHGGFRSGDQAALNYKPNYPSVMNYRYQFSGVDAGCDVAADDILDYSRGTRITLDEAAVDEPVGVCGDVAVDWNKDGDETGTGLSLDLQAFDNGPGVGSGNGSLTDILQDHDDWSNITLAGSVAGAPLPGGASLFKEVESCTAVPPTPGGG
jgi:hypothetical protein